MFLFGMGVSAIVIGALLEDFSKLRLIQVVQGSAVLTLILNLIAVWRQERIIIIKNTINKSEKIDFLFLGKNLFQIGKSNSLNLGSFWGTLLFNARCLLEPYGGQILGLSVSDTTNLTGFGL